MLVASSQTGVLKLLLPSGTEAGGLLYLQAGQIIHAEMEGQSGLDALSEICRLLEANFVFQEAVASPGQSLAVYPTPRLIEKIRQQMDELRVMQLETPDPADIPAYKQGGDLAGLNATPDELALLLQCSGEKTVTEIAALQGRTVVETAGILAKFKRAGLLDLTKSTGLQGDAAVQTPDITRESPRYWRGRQVE